MLYIRGSGKYILLLFLINPHLIRFTISIQCIPNLYLDTNLPATTHKMVLKNHQKSNKVIECSGCQNLSKQKEMKRDKNCHREMANIMIALRLWRRGNKTMKSRKTWKKRKICLKLTIEGGSKLINLLCEGVNNFRLGLRGGLKICVMSSWFRPPLYYWVINDQP